MKRTLIIGTRSSKLAIWQALYVKSFLLDNFSDIAVQIKEIQTTGDKNLHDPIGSFGGKGIFLKEIEDALLSKEIDLAVHSYKDVPTEIPPGLEIIAASNREDPRDVLVSRDNIALSEFSENSKIGTGSLRRNEQLKALKADIKVVPIRGNVDTRINKVFSKEYDGVVLAYAGIKRLDLEQNISQIFSVEEIVPSPLQGFVAVEAMQDTDLAKYFHNFSDEKSLIISNYERRFLKDLELNCDFPAGFCFEIFKDKFRFNYFLKGYKKTIKEAVEFNYSDLNKNYSEMLKKLLPAI